MFKTLGVLAHVDAGKTTFSEQLLFHTQSIRERGRVDHQDAYLDNHSIERQRGITIFAEQGRIQFKGDTYTLVDTPGHVDFSPEMERAISVMDYAIIIISAVEGIQGHTETVWHLLRQYNVPTFIFINKIDREGADVEGVMQSLKREFSEDMLLLDAPISEDSIPETVLEWIAERDEFLFDQYMAGNIEPVAFLQTLRTLINQQQAYVCAKGAALKDIGVIEFFEQLSILTQTHYDDELHFKGKVFKIRHDEQQQRITFIKALQGTLTVRDEFKFGDSTEKVTEVRLYNGNRFETVQQIHAGDIFAVKGLTQAKIGDILGNEIESASNFELVPTLQAKVVYEGNEHIKEILRYFRMLEAEEPTLRVVWSEKFQEINVHIMGVIQLEVLVEVAKERFNIDVQFEDPKILYMETIKSSVIGYGHFEPLKHYAEVHLKLEPNERGAGIEFINQCHADDLSVGHQRLIEKHLFERDHHGLLTGYPVTDLRVTLLTGRAHNKHTEGGDFREATFRALRQGLEQAENVLLEPYYSFKMKASNEHIGRMMTDIQQASGTFDLPIMTEDQVIIKGIAPVSTFMNYSTVFAAYTNGKGALSLTFSGYDLCHNAEAIIEQIGYDKNADPEYTSSSIFCAKGKGYSVPWDEAKDAMHCLK
ncbi:small GTP-binding protein [Lysinibacillus composti]|uniref:TetM/TetW/TetO/TetS family tetracycline resistance ribosomal protection protein n=1 Tax=Lysinibacillus composti TaxID=720633 RepID=A0A3N9UF84_9BACI|nr:TetM/TetW/TetO/TetS family tetracycline resistance ribosomal protection protein [Lysinibacillus composti]MBM7608511.1 small GTP-binding protein [Lysinibacillus composti]RQW74801.1 TetM/TetW/TetO/TetS family tetracycline resistance ribosomal protection protein [Lysinibacillus composti]